MTLQRDSRCARACFGVVAEGHGWRATGIALQSSPNAMLLHLAHSRAAAADATGAYVGAAAGSEAAHDGGGEESGEGEPEEGGGGLGLTAARAGAAGDDVAVEVVLPTL